MNNDDLNKIKGIVVEKKFKAHTTIFSENEEAKGFYFVILGRTKIFKLSPEGKEHVLHICGPGDMFAEAAMFSGNIYPAYATTITDSSLLFIRKKAFLELIRENPDISIKMLGALSLKLRKFTSMIEDLSLKEVSARIAKYLLDLSVHTGSKTFTLGIKKTDLALKLGTAGETLSRTLKKFKDKHIIRLDGNKICLLNIESLKEISAGMKV
ncbi:MAG: Crp/Fnr family transcriptional regulator, partial [Candidatus Anammoxibacter sp.]